jgi:hypothetical protein
LIPNSVKRLDHPDPAKAFRGKVARI